MSKKKIEIDKSDDGEAIDIKGIEPGKEVEAIPDILSELQSMLNIPENILNGDVEKKSDRHVCTKEDP